MEKLIKILIISVLLLLTACRSFDSGNPSKPTVAAEASTAGSSKPLKKERLLEIKDVITNHLAEIEERHQIKIVIAGVGKDHVLLGVRRSGDVERTVSDAELEALEKTVFGLAGEEFPIRISVQVCCTKEAEITGKITVFDKERSRILIVNGSKRNGDSEDSEAAWITLANDGMLVVDGKKTSRGFDASFVGREVKVWTTGVMAQSYPGQASAVKVVVE